MYQTYVGLTDEYSILYKKQSIYHHKQYCSNGKDQAMADCTWNMIPLPPDTF